jgi:hypothetical protein
LDDNPFEMELGHFYMVKWNIEILCWHSPPPHMSFYSKWKFKVLMFSCWGKILPLLVFIEDNTHSTHSCMSTWCQPAWVLLSSLMLLQQQSWFTNVGGDNVGLGRRCGRWCSWRCGQSELQSGWYNVGIYFWYSSIGRHSSNRYIKERCKCFRCDFPRSRQLPWHYWGSNPWPHG